MATAAIHDWDSRFAEFAGANPPDVRAIWTLIVECMHDDAGLSHTFNAALRAAGAPAGGREELRQDLALALTRMIRAHPRLNLEHRPPDVRTAAWLYGVVERLATKTVGVAARRHRRLVGDGADRQLVDDRDGAGAALRADGWRSETVDAAIDVANALAACDSQMVEVILAYSTDVHVETVARHLDLPHVTAWRRVRDAKATLRRQLTGYGR